MTVELINLFLDIVLILIVLYLALFKSYFQEKGKNIATKEDIEEITRKVESVKNEINFFNIQKIELIKEKKDTLLTFLEESNKHIYSSLRVYERILKDFTDVGLIDQALTEIRNQFTVTTNKYYRIFVYFNDKIVIDSADEYYSAILDLHNRTFYFLIELSDKSKLHNFYLEHYKKSKIFSEEFEESKKEIENLINTYTSERLAFEEKAIDKRTTYLAMMSIMIGFKKIEK